MSLLNATKNSLTSFVLKFKEFKDANNSQIITTNILINYFIYYVNIKEYLILKLKLLTMKKISSKINLAFNKNYRIY